MASFRWSAVVFLLVFATSSCSKSVVGTYSYQFEKRTVLQKHIAKKLVLSKDSSFVYTESFHEQEADDVVGPTYYYLGKGTYQVNGKQIILNFEPKFRKINKIEVIPISFDEATKIKDQNDFLNSRVGSDYFIIFNTRFDDFTYQYLSERAYKGMVMVNGNGVTLENIGFISYKKLEFPLDLNFDFSKLTFEYLIDYPGYLPSEQNTRKLSFNFGLLDEKINIEKPGYYRVNFHIFNKAISPYEEQIFTGQRVLPIKKSLGSIKIGQLKKADSKQVDR